MTDQHDLIRDGRPYYGATHPIPTRAGKTNWPTIPGRALCSCGVLSEPLPDTAARRAWHLQHSLDEAE